MFSEFVVVEHSRSRLWEEGECGVFVDACRRFINDVAERRLTDSYLLRRAAQLTLYYWTRASENAGTAGDRHSLMSLSYLSCILSCHCD